MEVKLSEDKKEIIITIPIIRRPSRSGKTMVVASTNGNVPSNLILDGKPLIVGVNAYISK